MTDWDPSSPKPGLSQIQVGDSVLKPGDRVRLRPLPRGDILDLFLQGKTAIIESIEQDFEDCIHLAVVVEDDPGKDLGMQRKPGHRFFFRVDEVEVLPPDRFELWPQVNTPGAK